MNYQLNMFQKGRILPANLETILVIFWAKNVVDFCLYKKNLPGPRMKSFRIVSLAERVSRQTRIDNITWLLGISLMQIYSGSEKLKQREMENTELMEKTCET